MPEPEGKLRDRLSRIENAITGAVTQLGQLQTRYEAAPTPATADKLAALETKLDELKAEWKETALRLGNAFKEKQRSKIDHGSALYEFLFGPDADPASDSGSAGDGNTGGSEGGGTGNQNG